MVVVVVVRGSFCGVSVWVEEGDWGGVEWVEEVGVLWEEEVVGEVVVGESLVVDEICSSSGWF